MNQKNKIMDVRIKKVVSWTIPFFGNDHIMPYGSLLVTDGNTERVCRTKGDRFYDNDGYQYIIFNRRRYEIIQIGDPAHGMKISLQPVS